MLVAGRTQPRSVHVVNADPVSIEREKPSRTPRDIDGASQRELSDDLKSVGAQRKHAGTAEVQNPKPAFRSNQAAELVGRFFPTIGERNDRLDTFADWVVAIELTVVRMGPENLSTAIDGEITDRVRVVGLDHPLRECRAREDCEAAGLECLELVTQPMLPM